MYSLETTPTNLIMVPGHATFRGDVTEFPENPYADDPWILQSFQTGEPPYYIAHIQKGIELLDENPDDSLLMFSGGLTRAETHWREADTYFAIAEHLLEESGLQHLAGRLAIEGYARDSFENVDFSYKRFMQLFGSYPLRMAVVGWGFKEERFGLHATEVGVQGFSYVGHNNPSEGPALDGAKRGEARTLQDYRAYPRGDGGKLLELRRARNLSREPIPYPDVPTLEPAAA